MIITNPVSQRGVGSPFYRQAEKEAECVWGTGCGRPWSVLMACSPTSASSDPAPLQPRMSPHSSFCLRINSCKMPRPKSEVGVMKDKSIVWVFKIRRSSEGFLELSQGLPNPSGHQNRTQNYIVRPQWPTLGSDPRTQK